MCECRINKVRVINMDSGPESLPLRHAVWNAEKPRCIPLKIAGNRRNCAGFAVKPDWRKCPAGPRSPAFERFSLLGTCAVRFQRLHRANAMRSQTDDSETVFRLLSLLRNFQGINWPNRYPGT